MVPVRQSPFVAGLPLLVACFTACSSVVGSRGEYSDIIRPDLRPPLVEAGTAADALWGPLEESQHGDGVAESRRAALEELVRRFTPTLVMPRGDHLEVEGRKFRLLPTNANLFADTLRVDLFSASPYEFQDSLNIVLSHVTDDSLRALADAGIEYQADPNNLVISYFDFPGANPREWWQEYVKLRTGPDSALWGRPTVYAHPLIDANGRTVIQYWHFYPFNDFIGNHEGDWEHINVVLTPDRSAVEQIHYYFHARSIVLPQGEFQPELVDGTHPVIYSGGRMYNIFDFPIRFFGKERNEGSHAYFPYPGEWEAAAGLGAPESVPAVGSDSSRVIPYDAFDVILMPEPSRFDYRAHPRVLREWGWLLFPIRFGFPAAPSPGSSLPVDVANRSWLGPSYHPGFNRTAPGLMFPAYRPEKLSALRSGIEDLLQPWYWLYIFRTPRYIHNVRGLFERQQLERLGLAPRGGGGERGFGTTLLGVQLFYPIGEFADAWDPSVGISFWRNLWAKLRIGAVEFLAGYQRLSQDDGSSLFVYPITASFIVRAPDARFRPYGGAGVGMYGWESRIAAPDGSRTLDSGFDPGWTAKLGLEYYLRTRVAFDVGVHFHWTGGPGDAAGIASDRLAFFTVWIGHYFRF